MSTHDNKATLTKFIAAMNTGDSEVIDRALAETMDPDVLLNTPMPTDASGVEGIRQGLTALLNAFPDLELTAVDLLEDGDKVVNRNVVRGTHRGVHFGIPPTGKTFTIEEIMVYTFRDGRVVEINGLVDVFSQMQQLGVIQA